MTKTTLKVKNGTITLPKEIGKAWKSANVFVFSTKDTLVVKKIQEPPRKLSGIAMRVSLPLMSQKEMRDEIASYRKEK